MTISDLETGCADPASHALAMCVRQSASAGSCELGFSWYGTTAAASPYRQVRSVFDHSLETGEPLPISNKFCDTSTYSDPADNVAFRFWHDVSHVCRGLSFALDDELELALWRLDELVEAGHARGSAVFAISRPTSSASSCCSASSVASPLTGANWSTRPLSAA